MCNQRCLEDSSKRILYEAAKGIHLINEKISMIQIKSLREEVNVENESRILLENESNHSNFLRKN